MKVNIHKKIAFNAAVEFVELGNLIKILKAEGGSSLIDKFEKDREDCQSRAWEFLVKAAEEWVEAEARKKARPDRV